MLASPERQHRRAVRRDRLLRAVYALGWRVGARVPQPLVRRVIRIGALAARRRDGVHVQTLRRNLTGVTGQPAGETLVERAVESYLRNFYEVLALPGWSESEILRRVSTVNEQTLRTAYAGPGAVVALPHSGNWDLAGAWACRTGMPVTTVAERLNDAEFNAFVTFRESLGMEVLSHRDPGVIADLIDAVRRGRLVCLLADRDLPGTGLPVRWGDHQITMPAGPAVVARRAGAVLLPAVCQFTGDGMRIVFGDPVAAEPGRAGLVTMTQRVADFFAATIAQQPADWHMMQPFFPVAEAGRR
jgi:lauroyl/myristoyl acyltransferase